MHVPLIGDVKPMYVYTGGALVIGFVGYAYYQKRKNASAAASAASTAASSTDTSGIDPATGIPYADENSSYGYSAYGGVDPTTGLPYTFESGSTSTNTSNTLQTNTAWAQTAEQEGTQTFGYSASVVTTAVGKYLGQSQGLNPDEYSCMQSVVAEIGPPPTGGPYRLIAANSSGTPPTGGTVINPPAGLRVVRADSTSIQLAWAVDPKATSYTVQYGPSVSGGTSNRTSFPPGQDGGTVGGLIPLTAYTFHVTAQPAGTGAAAATTSAKTTK